MMLRRSMLFIFVIHLFMFSAAPCYGYVPSSWTKEASYNRKMGGKLLFGLLNAQVGFTEIFQEPYEAVREGRNFWAGVGKGLVNGIGDTIGGVLHVATFFITGLDIPLPEGGVDIGASTD